MLGLRRSRETESYIPRSDVQKDQAITDLEARVARLEEMLSGTAGEDTCPSGYRTVKAWDETFAWEGPDTPTPVFTVAVDGGEPRISKPARGA